jgi:hypothetical protein
MNWLGSQSSCNYVERLDPSEYDVYTKQVHILLSQVQLIIVLSSLSLQVLAIYDRHHMHVCLGKIFPLYVKITCLMLTWYWLLIQIYLELRLKLKFLKHYSLLQSLTIHWSIFIWDYICNVGLSCCAAFLCCDMDVLYVYMQPM